MGCIIELSSGGCGQQHLVTSRDGSITLVLVIKSA